MADVVDRAQEIEQADRERALFRHTEARDKVVPLIPGVCTSCRWPIQPQRLAAMPRAIMCVECQEDHERCSRR